MSSAAGRWSGASWTDSSRTLSQSMRVEAHVLAPVPGWMRRRRRRCCSRSPPRRRRHRGRSHRPCARALDCVRQRRRTGREIFSRVKAVADVTTDAGVVGGPPVPITGSARASWGPPLPPGTPPREASRTRGLALRAPRAPRLAGGARRRRTPEAPGGRRSRGR